MPGRPTGPAATPAEGSAEPGQGRALAATIVGGGIGGLSAALFLRALGAVVRVFEEEPEVERAGLGINLQPYAIRELDRLGLAEVVMDAGVSCREWAFFNRQGQLIWKEPLAKDDRRFPRVSIGRRELHGILLSALQGPGGEQVVRWDHRFVDLTQHRGGVVATFVGPGGHRHEVESDLLVGADGIRSTVRGILHPDEGAPLPSGKVLWRGLCWHRPFLSGSTMALIGSGEKKFVAYPIKAPQARGPQLINWVAEARYPSNALPERWGQTVPKETVLGPYHDWHLGWIDVPDMVRESELVYQFAMMDRQPLTDWSEGSVTLVGDAAHPMYPVGSNGASQAIADASALAASLASTPAGDVRAALEDYESIRRPVANRIVTANRDMGPDRILDVVEERAPRGFRRREGVISDEEIRGILAGYLDLSHSSARP